jgi:hypothetical protein
VVQSETVHHHGGLAARAARDRFRLDALVLVVTLTARTLPGMARAAAGAVQSGLAELNWYQGSKYVITAGQAPRLAALLSLVLSPQQARPGSPLHSPVL